MSPQTGKAVMKTPLALLFSAFYSMELAAQAPALEEVVVTAQKRTESLQDVSVSVQVVTGEHLLDVGTIDFSDLSETLPAVNISKGGASDQLYIRGIGSGFNGGFEQAVGTYIDGIYVGRSRGTRASLVDLERIEVLKGPQTIFFGNSSIAGAFDVTSRSPDLSGEFQGHVTGLADVDHGETNIEVGIDIPVADNFALRLAGRKYDMDGYVRNTWTGEDVGGADETFVRLSALWEPTDNLRVLAKYAYGDSDKDAPFKKEVINCDNDGPGNPAGRPGSSCSVHGNLLDNNLDYKVQHGSPEFSKAEFSQTSLQLDWELDAFTVTAITGLLDNENRDLMDLDSGPFLNFNTNQYDDLEQFSQEIRLVSNGNNTIDWIVGGYYQDGEVGFDGNQMLYFIGAPPLQGAINAARANGNELGAHILRQQDEETRSAFASATYNATAALRFSLGVRWIEVEKDMDKDIFWALYDNPMLDRETRRPTAPPFGGVVTVGASTDSAKWDDVLPSASVEWDISANSMIYASASQGFKAGGFDFSDRDGNTNPTFDEETVDAYELGIKSRLLDNRLQFNAVLFLSEYEGVQQSVLDPETFTFSVSNASASTTQGLELDIAYAVTQNFTLSADVTFMEAQFDEFLGACNNIQISEGRCETGFQDLSDHETTYAPDYSGLVRADYTMSWDKLALTFSPQMYFTDSYYLQSDFDPFTQQDAYTRFDLRIALSDRSERLEVALVGKNLSDEKVMFFANDLPGSSGSYMIGLNRPRSYAIQGRWNF